MSSNIPRKRRRKVKNASEAVTTTVMALADAAARGAGVNLETTFPGGRMQLMVGTITVNVSETSKPEKRDAR